MKILSKTEFLKMPPGTIFSTYEPCIFGNLMIKGESIEEISDFTQSSLTGAVPCGSSDEFFLNCERMQIAGEEFDADFDSFGREGFFDDSMFYAVYSPSDVERLIATLKDGLESNPQ